MRIQKNIFKLLNPILMKTKIFTLTLIAFQFLFTTKKINAQGCGDFSVTINSNSFNFDTRVGTFNWTAHIAIDQESRFFCPGGWWVTNCDNPLAYSEKVTLQFYLNSSNTLNGSEVLLGTLTNVAQNSTSAFYNGDDCVRWLIQNAWNNINTTYTLPASISTCAFNSTYRYLIVKSTLQSNTSMTSTTAAVTPVINASVLGNSPLCTSGTYNNNYTVSSSNLSLSGLFTYTSSNPSWPVNGVGSSVSTTLHNVFLTVPAGASNTTLCVSGGNLCQTVCTTISGVAAVPAQAGIISYTEVGATCDYNAAIAAVPTATAYDWSFNSGFSPIAYTTAAPHTGTGDFIANATYTTYVRAKNVCGNGASRVTVKKVPKPTNCLARVADTDSTTAIEQTLVLEEQKFSIFPNPASSEFEVNILNKNNGVVYFKMMNIEGKLIKEISTTDARISISTSEIAAGLYFITINGEDLHITSKIQIIK